MTDSKSEEIQSELFQEFSGQPKKPERFPALNKTQKPILVSTSTEQIIFLSILLILALCLVFFLGVVRGKFLTPVAQVQHPTNIQGAAPVPVSHMLAMPQYRSQVRSDAVSAPAPKRPLPASSFPIVPAANKPYMIQLVTYKRADLADKDVLAFRRNGYQAIVVPSGDYYQVCVGQYATKDEAKKDLKFFGSRYKDCFLRRRN